jgi:Fanconi anemia group M protein
MNLDVKIDFREKNSQVNRASMMKNYILEQNNVEIFKNKGVVFNPTIESLPVGDVICGNVAVEIKMTPSDLISSSKDERLKNQVENMCANFEHVYLILMFSGSDLRTHCSTSRIPPEMVLGLLASVETRNKVHVKKYVGFKEGEGLKMVMDDLLRIFPKANDGKETAINHNPQRIQASTSDEQIRVLTGYPMISYDRAKNLLLHFGTLDSIFRASEKDLLQVDGIGKKIAQKFIEVNQKLYNSS